MQQAFSTFGLGERVSAGKEGVNVLRMALLRAGRMVLLHALLAHPTLAGLEAGINSFFISVFFLFESLSEKLAISIRALSLCAQRFSIREPF